MGAETPSEEVFDDEELAGDKARLLRQLARIDYNPGTLDEDVYDVSKFYWEEGFCQLIARNESFQAGILAVIVFNAIFIGISVEHSDEDDLYDAHWFFILGEWTFFAIFLF